jgi:hypothetical protein
MRCVFDQMEMKGRVAIVANRDRSLGKGMAIALADAVPTLWSLQAD